jgi:CRISPR system Cascade subunit CasE
MAFPTEERRQRDPDFLAPYAPNEFPEDRYLADRKKSEVDPEVLNQMHRPRAGNSGFLFRIDPQPGGRVVIAVQSATEPNWIYAFQNADHLLRDLLAAPPHKEPFEPDYHEGDLLRFRIRVNLSKKIKKSAKGVDLTKPRAGFDYNGRPKSQSMRVALTWNHDQNPEEVIRDWFKEKAEPKLNDKGELRGLGFEVESLRALQIGWGNGFKPESRVIDGGKDFSQRHLKFRSALLEGMLRVTQETWFKETLANGIGSGKAFGFGLLSVAPSRESEGPAGRPAT